MIKKLTSVILAVLCILTVLTGCGRKEGNKAKSLHIGYFNNITHGQALYMKARDSLTQALVPEPWGSVLLKLGTVRMPATVQKIRYRLDVNSGDEVKAEAVYKNELAVCDISLSEKIVFDQFEKNPSLGSFILIDRVSNATSACGVVVRKISRSDNLTWYPMDITRKQRAAQKGQKPVTIWLTGISAPYEVPESPDIEVDTSQLSLEEGIDLIMEKLDQYI